MKYVSPVMLMLMAVMLCLVFLTSVITSETALAQEEDTCPIIVKTALTTTQDLCDGTARDQACYGNISIKAQPQPAVGSFVFDNPGDIVDVASLRSLQLSAMDLTTGAWGVGLIEIRADLPSSKPENVTLLMFGDVDIQNTVEPLASTDASVAVSEYVNVRFRPSEKAGAVSTLKPGQTVEVLGRLADNSWLQIRQPESGRVGWVYAPLLAVTDDLDTLRIQEPRTPHYEPLQAFYFTSGADDNAPCAEMPPNGLLIQTPEGAGRVTLRINEVDIRIGSTVFFQAQPGNTMQISTLEGGADVSAFGVTYRAFAGTTVSVPLNSNMSPAGPPTPPEPYDLNVLGNLPIQLLKEQIVIQPPMRPVDIEALMVPASDSDTSTDKTNAGKSPKDASDTDSNGDTDTTNVPGNNAQNTASQDSNGDPCGDCNTDETDCPGNSCNAPGHSDCVGNSCNAPGQNKDDKDKDKDK